MSPKIRAAEVDFSAPSDSFRIGRGLRALVVAVPLWAIADQAVVSGGNFLSRVALGRLCGEAELGIYLLGLSLLVLSLNVPSALIWTSYNIRNPGMRERRLRSFTASIRAQMIAIALGAGLISLGMGLVSPSSRSAIFFVMAISLPFLLMREHVRRMAFARLKIRQALLLDMLVMFAQLAMLGGLYAADWLTGHNALLAAALAGSLALLVARIGAPPTPRVSWLRVVRDLRENWSLSKYFCLGGLIHGGSSAAYPWLLGLMAGSSEVGRLAAAEGVVFLANPLLIAATNYFGPAMPHTLRKRGTSGLRRECLASLGAITVAMACLTTLLGLTGERLAVSIFGASFANLGLAILSLSVAQLFEAMLIPVRSALMALHEARFAAIEGAVKAFCTFTIGYWAVSQFGAVGIGVGLVSGHLISLALAGARFLNLTRDIPLIPGGRLQ